MGTTASLFLFVLAGAFLFAYGCHYTSYLATRMEGRQLLLLVAYIAVGLLLMSRISLMVAEALLPEPVIESIGAAWDAFVYPFGIPAPSLSVFFTALLLGPALALLVNAFYEADKASTRIIRRYGGERERLLLAAMEDENLVSVTLDNRKVYIGWPVYTPDPRRETRDFRLLPAVSGYRDEKTLDLHLTTQYVTVYEKVLSGEFPGLKIDDFETVIPLEEVVSVNLFSLEIDQNLFTIFEAELDGSDEGAES